MAGATGSATTVQLTSLEGEVSQLVPVAVLLPWMIFVPVTALNEGTVCDQPDQSEPLLVLYLYSSVTVPVPPLPDVTETVSVCPEHTLASAGFFVSPGAEGSATTVRLPLI